mgnify:FL=1|tara:strand:- start:369 stop:1346 length:978 start_codon:yes stop_codon:yes gene_type:complete
MNKRNVNLATTTNITTTYAGESAGSYIAAALLSASTIDDGGLTVKANIAFKEVIKKLATNALVASASCDFSPTSTITLTERIIEPKELQVNLQLCKYDFVNDWEAQSMGYGLGQTLPPKFTDFMIAHVASEVAQNTEFCIWQGDTAAAANNSFDGFEKLIAASAAAGDIPAAQQVAAVAGGLLSTNIIDELSKVVDAIPAALYGKEDLFLYIGSKAAKLYVQALGGFGANGLGANGVANMGTQWWNNGSLTVNGVKIFVCPGMSDNKMYAAQRSNLYFGTGLLNSTNEVKVLDMSNLDASNNVRMVMRFTSAVQFGIASDLVEYA